MAEDKAIIVSRALAKSTPHALQTHSVRQLAPVVATGAAVALTWSAGKLVKRLLASRGRAQAEIQPPETVPPPRVIVLYHRSITVIRR